MLIPILVAGFLVVAGLAVAWQLKAPARKRAAAIAAAKAHARAAVEANPNDLDAKVKLAGTMLDLEENGRDALPLLESVLAAKPTHWTKGAPPTQFLLAHAHVLTGKLDVGITQYEKFLAQLATYDTGGDKEMKWLLETHKVDAEQRIRLLKRGDTHIHKPEQWGDAQ
ncbi:MAG: hypothetical protein IPH13_18635 [Planctomycetes bacterium]|nr:hypothetical protein [Planctomycetota bacterium]MCC7170782.1 hypothetical protein [Planctomycetota bacterium]